MTHSVLLQASESYSLMSYYIISFSGCGKGPGCASLTVVSAVAEKLDDSSRKPNHRAGAKPVASPLGPGTFAVNLERSFRLVESEEEVWALWLSPGAVSELPAN